MTLVIQPVDFDNPDDTCAYLAMLDAYASDPMGDGAPLDASVRASLIDRLRAHPTSRCWLAWSDGEPVGVVTAFVGFSTFKARPLINIHDVAVAPGNRGSGIGWKLLEAVEAYAREQDCCALTLEVLGENLPAKLLYHRFGFYGAETVDPPSTWAFLKKQLI